MLAILGGEVITMGPLGRYRGGGILVEEGKIVALGPKVKVPAGAEVLEATGMVITPGLIDAHTYLGLRVIAMGKEGREHNESTDPFTPHLRARDGLYGLDESFSFALRGGVTTVLTGPGLSNVVAGQSVVVKTIPRAHPAEMILLDDAGLMVSLGETPGKLYGAKGQSPSTRMGTAALLRDRLVRAQNYERRWEEYNAEKKGARPQVDLKMEALLKVLQGNSRLRVHAHLAHDIGTALRISDEFGLHLTIEGASEGHKVAEDLARRRVPVVWGPGFKGPMREEERGMSFRTPAALVQAGVKVALTTNAPALVLPPQYLPVLAVQAVKAGLDEEVAFRAITINPAEIIGVGSRVGSLETGKDADLVLWSGHPFSYQARTMTTIVDGQVAYSYCEGDDFI